MKITKSQLKKLVLETIQEEEENEEIEADISGISFPASLEKKITQMESELKKVKNLPRYKRYALFRRFMIALELESAPKELSTFTQKVKKGDKK